MNINLKHSLLITGILFFLFSCEKEETPIMVIKCNSGMTTVNMSDQGTGNFKATATTTDGETGSVSFQIIEPNSVDNDKQHNLLKPAGTLKSKACPDLAYLTNDSVPDSPIQTTPIDELITTTYSQYPADNPVVTFYLSKECTVKIFKE